MRRAGWAATVLLLACGERRSPPEPPPPPASVEEPKPVPVREEEPAAPPPPETDAEQLREQRTELVGRVAELARFLRELDERHARERAGLPRIDTRTRRSFLQCVQDARTAEHNLRRMEQRFRELEKIAKSGLTGKLRELTDKREAIERRRADIENAWQRSLDEARYGRVEESPVKKELYLVRAVKREWFRVSGPARRGKMTSDERWRILKDFRAWLDEDPERKAVVSRVLAHPLAPRWKTPDNYDFTDLEFYILLELLEDDLDRQNIAIENRELQENRVRLEAIRAELGAVVQEIHDAMAEGGTELSEYLDLLERLPVARENATYLSTRMVEWQRIFREVDGIAARQAREREEARVALERARTALTLVETELGRLR